MNRYNVSHLAVGHGLLGKVVEEDDGVLAVVTVVLAQGRARVGGQELERRRVGRRGGHDRRVRQGAVVGQDLDLIAFKYSVVL